MSSSCVRYGRRGHQYDILSSSGVCYDRRGQQYGILSSSGACYGRRGHDDIYSDAGTRLELIESAATEAQGASNNFTANISEGNCKEWCSNETKCVSAMYQQTKDGGICFIYYKKPKTGGKNGFTVFMKENITSSG